MGMRQTVRLHVPAIPKADHELGERDCDRLLAEPAGWVRSEFDLPSGHCRAHQVLRVGQIGRAAGGAKHSGGTVCVCVCV